MAEGNWSVIRVEKISAEGAQKTERHNERKNESYANLNVDTEQIARNVHFMDTGGLTYLLQKGEFAYNRSTSNEYPFGSIKRLELYPMGAVSTLYLCFAIKEEVVNSDLAKWYFESSQWYKGINNICAEGARNHGLLNVPTDGFFNTVHTLPSDPNEQLAVVDYLSNIQKIYEAAQRCLQAIENLRSGLLQQLFI